MDASANVCIAYLSQCFLDYWK